jgi:hypothetical protein
LTVLPIRLDGDVADDANAVNPAKMISEAKLCKAGTGKKSVLLKSPLEGPNELKALWDLAREVRGYLKKNPVDADYVIYADYVFCPKMGAGVRAFCGVRPQGRVGNHRSAELAPSGLPEHQADIDRKLQQAPCESL